MSKAKKRRQRMRARRWMTKYRHLLDTPYYFRFRPCAAIAGRMWSGEYRAVARGAIEGEIDDPSIST